MQRILNTETPLLMGKSGALFGMLARAGQPRGIGVLILNAGLLHNVGPFRLHVLLARLLSGRGFDTLRLDQSGKGESLSRPDRTYAESILEDYDDAVAALRQHGVTRIVLVGLCSGADDALRIASARDSVTGIVMLDGYAPKGLAYAFHHYSRRAVRPGVWLRFFGRLLRARTDVPDDSPVPLALGLRNWKPEPEMLADIGTLLARGARMLAVFTGGVEDYYSHAGQLSRHFQDFAGNGRLQEVFFPEAEHTYVTVRHRDHLLARLEHWFCESFPGESPADAPTAEQRV